MILHYILQPISSLNQRMVGVGRSLLTHPILTPCHRDTAQAAQCPFSLAWSSSGDEAPSVPPGSASTLIRKDFYLIYNLHITFFSLKAFPFLLCVAAQQLGCFDDVFSKKEPNSFVM